MIITSGGSISWYVILNVCMFILNFRLHARYSRGCVLLWSKVLTREKPSDYNKCIHLYSTCFGVTRDLILFLSRCKSYDCGRQIIRQNKQRPTQRTTKGRVTSSAGVRGGCCGNGEGTGGSVM